MKRFFSWLLIVVVLLEITNSLGAQEVQKYVLKLKKGEQFISLPVAPSDNRVESIFGPILKYIVKIEYYDPEKGKWLCYIPSAVGEANSLKEIPAGSAFYIEVSNDTEVTIYGKPLEYGDYKLYPGWNAIGVPKEVTPAELDRGMADAKVKNRFVLGYDELYKESKPSERKRVAVGEKLEPGKGYWVNTDPDGDHVSSSTELARGTDPLTPNISVAQGSQSAPQLTLGQTTNPQQSKESMEAKNKVDEKYKTLESKYPEKGEDISLGDFLITDVRYNTSHTKGIGLLKNKNLPESLKGLLSFFGSEVLVKLDLREGEVHRVLNYDSSENSFPGIILGEGPDSLVIKFGDGANPVYLQINKDGKLVILLEVENSTKVGIPQRNYYVHWIEGDGVDYVRLSTVFGGEAIISKVWEKTPNGSVVLRKASLGGAQSKIYKWFVNMPAGCKDMFEPHLKYIVMKGNNSYQIDPTAVNDEDPEKWLPGEFDKENEVFKVPIDGVYLLRGFFFLQKAINYRNSKALLFKENDEGELVLTTDDNLFHYENGNIIVSFGPGTIYLRGWHIIPTVESYKEFHWDPSVIVKIGYKGDTVKEISLAVPFSAKITAEIFNKANKESSGNGTSKFKKYLSKVFKRLKPEFGIGKFSTGAIAKLLFSPIEESTIGVQAVYTFTSKSQELNENTTVWKVSRSLEMEFPIKRENEDQEKGITVNYSSQDSWQSKNVPSIKSILKLWQAPPTDEYESEMEVKLQGQFPVADSIPLIGGQTFNFSFGGHLELEDGEWKAETVAQIVFSQGEELSEDLDRWKLNIEMVRIEFDELELGNGTKIQALKNYIKKIAKIKKKGAIGQNVDGLKVKKVIALVTLEPKEGSFLYPGSIETTVVIERKIDFNKMVNGGNGYYWDVTFNAGLNKVYEESGCKFTLNSLLVKFKWYPGNSTGGTWKEKLRSIAKEMIIGGSATLAISGKSYTGFFLYQGKQFLFMANYSSSSGVIRNAQVFAQIPLKKGNPWTVMLDGSLSGKDLAEALGISPDLMNGNFIFNGWVDANGLQITLQKLPFNLQKLLPDWVHVKEVKNVSFYKSRNGTYSLQAEIDISMEHFVDKTFTVGLVIKKGEGVALYGRGIGPFEIGKVGTFEINEIKISKEHGVWEAGGTITYTLPEKWREAVSEVGLEIPEKIELSYTHSKAGFIATGKLDPAPAINIPYLNLELEVSSVSLSNTSPWKFSLNTALVKGDHHYSGKLSMDNGDLVFEMDPGFSFSVDLSGGVILKVSDFKITLGKNMEFGGKVTVNIPSSNVMHNVLGDQFSAYLEGSKSGFTVSTFTNIDITQTLGSLGKAEFSIDRVSISSDGSISGSGFIALSGISAKLTIGTKGSNVYFVADFGKDGVGIDLGSIFAVELYNQFKIQTLAGFQSIQIDDIRASLGAQQVGGISLNGEKIVYILPTSIPPWGFAFFDNLEGNVHVAGFAVNVGVRFPAPRTEDAVTVFDAIKGIFTGGSIDWNKLASLERPSFSLHDIYIAFPMDVLKKIFGSDKLVLINDFTVGPKSFVKLVTASNAFDVINAIIPKDKRHGNINLKLLGFDAGASYDLKPDQPVYETHVVPNIQNYYAFLQRATYVDKNCGDTPQSLLASGEGVKLVFLSYASDSKFGHNLGHAEGGKNNFQQSLREAIKDFYKSGEYRNLMKNVSDKDYIKSLFKVVLNRNPNDEELKEWIEKYNKKISEKPNDIGWKQEVRAELIPDEFFATPEAQSALNSIQPTDKEIDAFVTRLYKDILNREPDFGGFYNWKRFVTPGRAWVVNAGETGHGWAIVYGPYISLPPGTYAATFEIKVEDNTLNGEAVAIDVSAEAGRKVLANRKILYRDFRFPNQYQKFTLVFTLNKGETGIETRVWRRGTPQCKIYVRRIKLVSGIKKETHTIALPERLGGGEAKVTWELKDITDQLESLQHLLRDLSPYSNTGGSDYLNMVWNRLMTLAGGSIRFDYNEKDKCAEAVFPYDAQTVVKVQFYEYDRKYDVTGLKIKDGRLYGRFGKVTLYVDADFKGTSSVITDDVSYCGNIAVGNDRVTSVKIEGRGKAVLYQDADYRGIALTVEESEKSLTNTIIGNDQVSSVKVFFPIDFKEVSRWRIKVLSYDPSDRRAPLFVTVIDAGAVQTVFYNADGSKTILLGLVPNGPVFKAMEEAKQRLTKFNPFPRLKQDPGTYLTDLWNTYFQPYINTKNEDERTQVTGTLSIRREMYGLTLLSYDGKPVTGLKIEGNHLKAKTGTVILYADPNFKGNSLPVNSDIPDLSKYGFANVASSIKLENATGAILYPDKDYKPLMIEKVFLYKKKSYTCVRGYMVGVCFTDVCMSIHPPSSSGIPGNQFYLNSCNWNNDQAFYLIPYGNDYYSLKSVADGGCADVFAFAKNDGAAISLYPCNGYSNQQWKLIKKKNGYMLQAKHSYLCLGGENKNSYEWIKQKNCDPNSWYILWHIKHTGEYIRWKDKYYVTFSDSWLGDNPVGNDRVNSIRVYFDVDTGRGPVGEGALNMNKFNIWAFYCDLAAGGSLDIGRRKIQEREFRILRERLEKQESEVQLLNAQIKQKQNKLSSLYHKKETIQNLGDKFAEIWSKIKSNLEKLNNFEIFASSEWKKDLKNRLQLLNNIKSIGMNLDEVKSYFKSFEDYLGIGVYKEIKEISDLQNIIKNAKDKILFYPIRLRTALEEIQDYENTIKEYKKHKYIPRSIPYPLNNRLNNKRNFKQKVKLAYNKIRKELQDHILIVKEIIQSLPTKKIRNYKEFLVQLQAVYEEDPVKGDLDKILKTIKNLKNILSQSSFRDDITSDYLNITKSLPEKVFYQVKYRAEQIGNSVEKKLIEARNAVLSDIDVEISITENIIKDLQNRIESKYKSIEELRERLKDPSEPYISVEFNSELVMIDVKYENGTYTFIPRAKMVSQGGGYYKFPEKDFKVIVKGKSYSITNLMDVSQYVRIVRKTYYIPPGDVRVVTNGRGAFWAKYEGKKLSPEQEGSSFTGFDLKADDSSVIHFKYGSRGGEIPSLSASLEGHPIPLYKENGKIVGVRKLIKIIPGGFFANAHLNISVPPDSGNLLYMGVFIAGQIKTDGSFYFDGNGSLKIGGYTVANARILLSSERGLLVTGRLQISSTMYADIKGVIEKTSSGTIFSFTGKASLIVGGEKYKTGLEGTLAINNDGFCAIGNVYLGGVKVRSATFMMKDGKISWKDQIGIGFAGIDYTIWILFKHPYGAGFSGRAFLDADVPIKIFAPLKWKCKKIFGVKICIPYKWGWKTIGHIRTHFSKEIAHASIEGSKVKIGIWEADLVVDFAGPSVSVEW